MMRSKPIRIQSQRNSVHHSNHNDASICYMMATSLDNYSHGQLFRREARQNQPKRQGIYHAGYMERRMAILPPPPRYSNTNHAVPVCVTPVASVGGTTPSPMPPQNPSESLLSDLLSLFGDVPSSDQEEHEVVVSSPPPPMTLEVDKQSTFIEGLETCDPHPTDYDWTTVYCVLLDDTLYMYQNQVVAESEAAVLEREKYRNVGSASTTDTPNIANIRLPLDSVASVRSAGQEYGDNSLELVGEENFILKAPDSQEMQEWFFQFIRSTTTVLRGLMDTARSSNAAGGVEYSPIRRRMLLNATASYSPRLSLTHGHGRSRRRYHELEDNHDHILPFPIDGNQRRLVSPLLPRRDCVEPELCMPQTASPETERPMPYIPPHRRKNQHVVRSARVIASASTEQNHENPTCLGGCADPLFVAGSIMDDQFIPRKASILKKVCSEPFGFKGDGVDIGAFSECGPAKETNEDSFMISTDLHRSFERPMWDETLSSKLFCIFDGHGGDHAARFAAEQLTKYMYRESLFRNRSERIIDSLESILNNALLNLDTAFCNFCQEGGRDWDSGSTALVALLIEKKLIVGNIGDSRGIIGRTVDSAEEVRRLQALGWNELSPNHGFADSSHHLWKEVTDIHSPRRVDEAERITLAGGWITHEQEIPVSQLKRMDLDDDEVYKIVQRCFADRYEDSPSHKASAPNRVLQISRACGDLAVSRALGDRHYKASYNVQNYNGDGILVWDSSDLLLCDPENRCRFFMGDIVSNQPEFISEEIGNAKCEFLLLACDGLWDVLDADDAYRITHDLLFEKEFSSRMAAARLAELAIHLGSSDNVTVIVVRFL